MGVMDIIYQLEKKGSIRSEVAEHIRSTTKLISGAMKDASYEPTEYEKLAAAVPEIKRIPQDFVMQKLAFIEQRSSNVLGNYDEVGKAILRYYANLETEKLAQTPAEEPSGGLTQTNHPNETQAEKDKPKESQEGSEKLTKDPYSQDVSKIREKLVASHPPLGKIDVDLVDEHIRNLMHRNPAVVVDDPEGSAKAISKLVYEKVAPREDKVQNPGLSGNEPE